MQNITSIAKTQILWRVRPIMTDASVSRSGSRYQIGMSKTITLVFQRSITQIYTQRIGFFGFIFMCSFAFETFHFSVKEERRYRSKLFGPHIILQSVTRYTLLYNFRRHKIKTDRYQTFLPL